MEKMLWGRLGFFWLQYLIWPPEQSLRYHIGQSDVQYSYEWTAAHSFTLPAKDLVNVPLGANSTSCFVARLIKLLCIQARGPNILFSFPKVF